VMTDPVLYIKWNDDCRGGHPLLEEQHRGLVATINSIHYFIQKGWEIRNLSPTLHMLETFVSFHLSTELVILHKCDPDSNIEQVYEDYRKSFLQELHEVTESAILNNEPEELTRFLAKWWMGHLKNFHKKVEPICVAV